jgi:hypothetical protein
MQTLTRRSTRRDMKDEDEDVVVPGGVGGPDHPEDWKHSRIWTERAARLRSPCTRRGVYVAA